MCAGVWAWCFGTHVLLIASHAHLRGGDCGHGRQNIFKVGRALLLKEPELFVLCFCCFFQCNQILVLQGAATHDHSLSMSNAAWSMAHDGLATKRLRQPSTRQLSCMQDQTWHAKQCTGVGLRGWRGRATTGSVVCMCACACACACAYLVSYLVSLATNLYLVEVRVLGVIA